MRLLADMVHCLAKDCPLQARCLRATDPPEGHPWTAQMEPARQGDDCSFFVPMED